MINTCKLICVPKTKHYQNIEFSPPPRSIIDFNSSYPISSVYANISFQICPEFLNIGNKYKSHRSIEHDIEFAFVRLLITHIRPQMRKTATLSCLIDTSDSSTFLVNELAEPNHIVTPSIAIYDSNRPLFQNTMGRHCWFHPLYLRIMDRLA